MSDDSDDSRDDAPRILRVNRRRFLGRSLAAIAGGGLASAATARGEGTRDTTRQETTLDRFRLFLEPRAFTDPVREAYPILDDPEPRLVATSEDAFMALWSTAEPSAPRFKGRQRHGEGVRFAASGARPFRRPAGEVTAASDDGRVVAGYVHSGREVSLDWDSGRRHQVVLPSDRGLVVALGLGPDGAGLAVAMEMGGILLYDLREGARFVGEFADPDLAHPHVCAPNDDCSEWSFAPCACDVVDAGAGDHDGATVSQYDRVTGTVTTQTLPCGSPLPAGAVCVCNCVAIPVGSATRTICTCDLVCTCDTVSTSTTYTYTYWYPN